MICAGLATLTGCLQSAVEVEPGTPEGPGVAMCRDLGRALPETLDGRSPRDVEPDSPFSAAWGDPAVVLRCGAEVPDVLDPRSEAFEPTVQSMKVDGVDWYPEQEKKGTLFTTVDRRTTVQVWVPTEKDTPADGTTAPLVDLAEAVRTTVPTRL